MGATAPTAPRPPDTSSWTYTDGSAPPPSGALFWTTLAVLVAHIFLWPLAAAGVLIALARNGGDPGAYGAAALVLAYAAWALVWDRAAPHSGARYSPWFVRPWVRCHHTFPVMTLLWTGAGYSHMPVPAHADVYDTARQTYIFAMHPHGVIPIGAAVFGPQIARWNSIASRLRVGVHDALFKVPLVRDFYLRFGAVSASRATLLHQLRDLRHSVLLLPGGVTEQLLVVPEGSETVLLRRRKGFVRLALETGSALVPVFCFGERQAYKLNEGINLAISRGLKRLLGIGLPLPRGRWWTLMWLPARITIVVGRPLPVARVEGRPPSDAEVDALHAAYCDALAALHAEHRDAAGHGHVELDIR